MFSSASEFNINSCLIFCPNNGSLQPFEGVPPQVLGVCLSDDDFLPGFEIFILSIV